MGHPQKQDLLQEASVWDRYFSLVVHAGLVILVVICLAVATLSHGADDGGNIGQGMGWLLLAGMGLPWSLIALVGPNGSAMDLVVVASVIANLALHLGLLRRHHTKRAMAGS